jgi:hypothetical protein
MDLPFMPSQIELWPIERLRPYARNARLHSDEQVAALTANMLKFGWTMPCMISDDGELIAGHGRIMAATQLGLTKIPVIRMSHLDEDSRRAMRLSDNGIADMATWDELALGQEAIELSTLGFDMGMLGFSPEFLDNLLKAAQAGDDADGAVEGEDDVPAPPADPISRPGDLWVLGNHRLICGDSTSADVVEKLLGSVRPLLMVTDPPYGVEYDPSWRNQAGAAKTKRTGKVLNDDRADWREAWALFPGDVAYI